jgi:hypothetical protein
MDEQVHSAITAGLRKRGVDCLTAQEDGMDAANDPDVLDRAASLRRVLFTQDQDFLVEAARRQRNGVPFAGVGFAHQMRTTIGQCTADLEIIAKVTDPPDWLDRLEYLPL